MEGSFTTLQSPPCSTSMYSNGQPVCEMLYSQVKVEPDTHYPSNGYSRQAMRPDHFSDSCRQNRYNGHNLRMDCMRQDSSSNFYSDTQSSCSKMSPHCGGSPPGYSSYPVYNNNSMQSPLSCALGMQRPRKSQGMSIWAKTQLLPQELLKHVSSLYESSQIPIEVRHYFADWIEEQPWGQIDESNPTQRDQLFAEQLLNKLIEEIENKSAELPQQNEYFLLKLKFQEVANQFRSQYSQSPLELVRTIKRNLATEEALVRQHENPDASPTTVPMPGFDKDKLIMSKIESVGVQVSESERMVKELTDKQEVFTINYQKQLQINSRLNQTCSEKYLATLSPEEIQRVTEMRKNLEKQKKDFESVLAKGAQTLINARVEIAEKLSKNFEALEEVRHQVVDQELIEWKRQQQLAGNGAPFDPQLLDNLQKWVESTVDLVWRSRQQVIKLEGLCSSIPLQLPNGKDEDVSVLNNKITSILSSIVTSTFIVEHQPPQVLKRDSRFSARVRLLVGGKLTIHLTPPTVTASIISEAQAKLLLRGPNRRPENNCGKILNNSGTMEFQPQKGELSIEFRNMILKSIKRAEKRGTEAVTEEKFCILFQSSFHLGMTVNELQFEVWTISLPVVVTVHGNQECNAVATVLWDNQFSEPGRMPFTVPDQVPWPDLVKLLDIKFKSMAERGLTLENKQYLATKLFGGSIDDNFSQKMVTWSAFNRDPLQSRNYTFWEWFYQAMKLTKEHMRGPWKEGYINGFISKLDSQRLLEKCNVGTFLLRFSDNFIGGITIAWLAEDKTGKKQIWNLQPFSGKDFQIRGLAERINDLPQLLTLYPDIPKQIAFSRFMTQTTHHPGIGTDGYIPHNLRMVPDTTDLNDMNGFTMSPENPLTPQPLEVNETDSIATCLSPQSNVCTTTADGTTLMDLDQYELQELPGSGMDYNADNVFELNDQDFNDINFTRLLESAGAMFSTQNNINGNMNTMNGSPN
ncbi:signal transducer and activator of transcription 5A-like [Saccostrea echinata]|uniref:signal transducer and activator of transcription 5A-like n=1 Tax=Saccostrea echinata TaxID=191078 RepID=UPI002A81CA83|nr:signal transducer and activator of transcription 5A-like [Saccostrea echinata]